MGLAQGAHEVEPQEFTLSFATQRLLQLCCFVGSGQVPSQAAAMSMQLPLQSFCPDGQEPPHCPWQVRVPPGTSGQALHDDVPQLSTLVSSTHLLPHW
jgi:hypothetical protein